MEFRKLISFGKTSFVMSLPKSWIQKNKLKKGDLIGLQEREEGLVLLPKKDKDIESEVKRITINVDGKPINRIQREIGAAYINNFNIITITGKELKDKTKEIKDALRYLIALEIVEQTSDKILAKDFLNMEKISITNLIRKMDIITRDMFADTKLVLKDRDPEEIINRDEEINRLSYLLFRAINYALSNPDIARIYKLNSKKLVHYWFINTAIEKIGDSIKRVARNLTELEPKLAKPIIDEFVLKSEQRYLGSMKSFYNGDLDLAYKHAGSKKEVLKECEEFSKKHASKWLLEDTMDKIKQMLANIHDIDRIVYLFSAAD